MTFGDIRDYCVARRGAVEEMPFGPDVLVFKVGGRMFALLSMDRLPPVVTLKCDPEHALELRARYEAVQPGYHMNKRHWNTVTADGTIPRRQVLALIDHSHELVVAGLPKRVRTEIVTR